MNGIDLFKFSTWTGANLPSALLAALDRNFTALLPQGPFGTTLNGFVLRSTDTINSLRVDATAANTTVYLPSSPTGNRRRTVTKIDSSVNVVIIDGNGTTIYGPGGWKAGVTQAFLNGQWESITFEPTGTSYIIVAAVP